MKISEIQIERYGVWRNLKLPLAGAGLSVFYGPNEAGKTTLMRFIRGILYGFTPRPADAVDSTLGKVPMFGSLEIEGEGSRFRLQRVAIGGSRGDLSAPGSEAGCPAGELLDGLLQGTDEKVFESLFAIGLRELQELATLSDDDVARHIYGLTLGLEGRRLLEVSQQVQTERDRLIDPAQACGELVDLCEQHDRLTAELHALGDRTRQHGQLAARRQLLEQEIADLEQRQTGIESQLRGHLFLERAWGPWNRVRECTQELRDLPVVAGFPEQGLERLDRIDADIAATAEQRDLLHGEARQIRQQIRKIVLDTETCQHAAAMQGCVDQRGWIVELQGRVKSAEARVEEAELQFEARREQLGADWTVSRLEAIDTSAAANHRLAGTARSVQSAVARCAAVKRSKKRMAASVRRQKETIASRLAELDGESVAAALSAAHEHLDELKHLAQLRLYEGELHDRQVGIEEHIARIAPRTILPNWVYVVLGVFCFSGVILAGGGLITGAIHSGIAGAVYALLAITVGGLAWGLKHQFEGDVRGHLDELRVESQENLAELHATQEAVHRLTGSTPPPAEGPEPAADDAGGTPMDSSTAELETEADEDADDLTDHDETSQPDQSIAAPTLTRVPFKVRARRSFAGFVTRVKTLNQARRRRGLNWTGLGRLVGERCTARYHAATIAARQAFRRGGRAVDADAAPGAAHATSPAESDESRAELEELSERDLIRQATHSIAELEHLSRAEQRLKLARRKLARMRNRLEISRREVGTARHSWQALLAQLGFPETLGVGDALGAWQLLVEATERRRDWKSAERDLEIIRDIWNGYQQRIKELGHRMQAFDLDYQQPLAVLEAWEKQLATLSRQRKQRRELKAQARVRRHDAAEFESLVDDLKLRRNALLVQGGAADRDEFEDRARTAARRTFLEDQSLDASRHLDSVARDEPDLALVEEDLLAFNAETNGHCIETLKLEQDDLSHDAQQAFEQRGRVKHELQVLEDDRSATRLRFELEQVRTRLHEAAEAWFAVEATSQLVDGLRSRFERTRQPGTLALASQFLTRLTCGKYRNIWTPLGKRQLRIDDDHDLSLPVECLSCGTREQLFLAVRLAVVQELARQGIVLPMILDDVIVNFDQQRAEAAVDLLLEFAARGHQILFFTCHLHLAQLFQSRGIEPNWLPSHTPPAQEQSEHRLAG